MEGYEVITFADILSGRIGADESMRAKAFVAARASDSPPIVNDPESRPPIGPAPLDFRAVEPEYREAIAAIDAGPAGPLTYLNWKGGYRSRGLGMQGGSGRAVKRARLGRSRKNPGEGDAYGWDGLPSGAMPQVPPGWALSREVQVQEAAGRKARNVHGWLLEAPWEDKPSRFFFPERHGAQCRHFISFLHRYLAGSIRHDAPAVTFATARGARPDHELLNDDFCALCKQGGNLLMCDSCARSYDRDCVGQLAEDEPADDEDYMCILCRFKAHKHSSTAANSSGNPDQTKASGDMD